MISRDVEWLVIMSRRAFRRWGRNKESTEIAAHKNSRILKSYGLLGKLSVMKITSGFFGEVISSFRNSGELVNLGNHSMKQGHFVV